MQDKNENVALGICDAAVEEDGLWAACNDFNALLYYDFERERVTLIDTFPALPLFIQSAFECALKVGNVLVFVPGCVDVVYTYHIVYKNFRKYSIPKELRGGKYSRFTKAFAHNNEVYMVGYTKLCILCLDISTGEITYYKNMEHEFFQKGYKNEHMIVDKEICLKENRIFLPPRNGDCIIEFNMETKQFYFHDFNYKGDEYLTLYYDDGFFWSYGIKNRIIIQMNDKFEIEKEISLDTFIHGCKNYGFRFSYKKGNYIWMFFYDSTRYIKVDIVRKKIDINLLGGQKESFYYFNMKQQDKKIYIFEPEEKRIYKYNENFEQFEKIQLKILKSDFENYCREKAGEESVQERGREEGLILENMLVNLDCFLSYTLGRSNAILKSGINSGRVIFEKL